MNNATSSPGPMAAAIARRIERQPLTDSSLGWLKEIGSGVTLDLAGEYGVGVLPENVIQAVEKALDVGETHYTDRPGLPALRQAVAQKLAGEQGFTVDPVTEVIISCGGQEGMYLALQVLAQPGCEVLIPDPCPAFLSKAVRQARGAPVPVSLQAEEGFEMKASRILEHLTGKTRLLVLSNPSNPTGAVISAEEMARIAALAQEYDLLIVSDESLDGSLAGDVRHRSVASFSEAARRTVVVGSFSRLHSLASWRVGYFAGPRSLVQPIRDLKQAMTICTSAMAQYAALEVLTGPQGWLKQRRATLDAKRAYVLKALDKMGLPHSRPAVTPYVFVDVRGTGLSSEEFSTWLLAESRVAVVPGSQFGLQGEGYVRLSLWSAFSELEQAMRRMKWALDRAFGGGR